MLLCLLLVLFSVSSILPDTSPERFLVRQKQHDLMRVWLHEGSFDTASMEADFRFVFPENEGVIEAGGKRVPVKGVKGNENSVVEAYYVKGSMQHRLTLTVTY
jgi:hypothetical protein